MTAGKKATCERSLRFAGPGVVSREAGAVVEDHGNPSTSDQPAPKKYEVSKVFEDLQTRRSAGLGFEGRVVVSPWVW